jgi:hypothetical protein
MQAYRRMGEGMAMNDEYNKPDAERSESIDLGNPELENNVEITVSHWDHRESRESPSDPKAVVNHVLSAVLKTTRMVLGNFPHTSDTADEYETVEEVKSSTLNGQTVQIAMRMRFDTTAMTNIMAAVLIADIANSTQMDISIALDPTSTEKTMKTAAQHDHIWIVQLR